MTEHNEVGTVGKVGTPSNKSTNPTNPTITTNRTSSSRKPKIIDSIREQDGQEHYRVGTKEKGVWFSGDQLLNDPKGVFRLLGRSGVPMHDAASQNLLKKLVQEHDEFRAGLAASRPGWLENHFVCGDTRVISAPGNDAQVVVVFGRNEKFSSVGTLAGWQKGIAPTVIGQNNCLFALAIGFAGAIAPFMPPGYTNVIAEIVGALGSGKSTLGALSASIFAGRTASLESGGESWSLTRNALPELANMHRHQTLFLDEANLVQEDGKKASEFFRSVIFSLSEGYDRLRYNDLQTPERFQCVVVSSANQPLRDFVKGDPAMTEALNSRVITVMINGPHGVLDHVPKGFETSREAVEAMRAALNENFGVAGGQFVGKLAEILTKRKNKLDAFIAKHLARYMKMSVSFGSHARLQKQFAMIALAGHLAENLKVVPREWGGCFDAVLKVHQRMAAWEASVRPLTAIEEIQRYIRETEDRRISMKKCLSPESRQAFESSSGCIGEHEGARFLIVSPSELTKALPDAQRVMSELRATGAAKTEAGKHPKLSTKPPKSLRHLGRVYWIWLPD